MIEKNGAEKIIGIPSKQIVSYVTPTIIKYFNFFKNMEEIQPASLENISEKFNFDKRILSAMLDYLVKENLLIMKGGKYSLSKISQKFLTKEAKYDFSNFILLVDGNVPEKIEKDICFALKTGTPAKWSDETWEDSMKHGRISLSFSEKMMARGMYLRDLLVSKIKFSKKDKKLLDIGGSLGDYCAFTNKFKNLSCFVYDLKEVVKDAKINIQNKSYKRVHTIPGDMFKEDFPKDFDIHFYSNVLHDWTEEKILLLFSNSYKSLNKGGKIIIHDMHIDNKKSSETIIDHSLYLSIYTLGKLYSFEKMKRMLGIAGFKRIKSLETGAGYSIIFAEKAISS